MAPLHFFSSVKTKHPLIFLCCILLFSNALNTLAQKQSNQDIGIYFFHQKIAEELGVEKSNFRLSQGSVPIGRNSLWLWNIFNSTGAADSIYSNTAITYSFSDSYELLMKVIENDSSKHECVLNDAQLLFCSTNQRPWNRTLDELITQFSEGTLLQIAFDTTVCIVNGSNNETWNVQFKVDLYQTVLFDAYPYAPSANSMNLPGIKPWFLPCFLSEIYKNENNSFLTDIEWQHFFGENGMMHTVCAGLVVIESGDIQMKLTREWWRFWSKMKLKTAYDSPSLLGVVLVPIQQIAK